MPVGAGDLFITLSRASRRIWNIQRRLLLNIPNLMQTGEIDKERADQWVKSLRSLSSSIFTDGLVFTLGPTISVMGPQGVGKSTLVNEILSLDGDSKLPSNPEEGERLPILIMHKKKARLFGKEDAQALYINLDRRSAQEPEKLTYSQAREKALQDQSTAGWLLWFAESDILERYNIFLAPGVKSSRLWLNEILQSMTESATLNLIVLDSRRLKIIDYRPIIENFYKASTPFYAVLTFSDAFSEEERKHLLDEFSQSYRIDKTRVLLLPSKERIEYLKSTLKKSRDTGQTNVFRISKHILEAQIIRGEIEKSLGRLDEEELLHLFSGPIVRKFDALKKKISKEFSGFLRMAFNSQVLSEMFESLNDIINKHTRTSDKKDIIENKPYTYATVGLGIVMIGYSLFLSSGIFQIFTLLVGTILWLFPFSKSLLNRKETKFLETEDIPLELMDEFSSIINKNLKESLYELIESHVEKHLESVFRSRDKETVRLEWPNLIMYVHLTREPDKWLDKFFNYSSLVRDIDRLRSSDTELMSLLDPDKFEHRSLVEKAIDKNIHIFSENIQMEISNIEDMFVFEDIKVSIAREKLNSLLFRSIEEFQEAVAKSLEEELETLKDRFLHEYHAILGMKEGLSQPILLQEALSKARIELDRAIDMMTSIL